MKMTRIISFAAAFLLLTGIRPDTTHRRRRRTTFCDKSPMTNLSGVLGSYFIITIGNNQHGGSPLNTSAKKLQEVERGFVGPVSIFNHGNGR